MVHLKEKFENWAPQKDTTEWLDAIDSILTEYQEGGHVMTLRQLYYQMVGSGYITNNEANYDKMGRIVTRGRMAGLIDWDMIVDLGRYVREVDHREDPNDAMHTMARQYHIDHWIDQPNRVEVWIEKEALVGVVQATCQQADVPLLALRGYVSSSALRDAEQRFKQYQEAGQKVHIIHMGDHDPSGMDMTGDIIRRLKKIGLGSVLVHRIALNMDQVNRYRLPPDFAKLSDTRAKEYIEEFGDKAWELDALGPDIINGLLGQKLIELIEREKFEAMDEKEEREKGILQLIADNFEDQWPELLDGEEE